MEAKTHSETRRLVLAKSLYLHGCTHGSRKDNVSRMLAIHHFDNAVEIVLRCVVTKQDIRSKKKYLYFEDLLDEIDDLPLKEQMRGLHRARNGVQHQGVIPSTESVIEYKGYTEGFFREVCRDKFHIPYEELYLSELIANDSLKKKVREAEEAFEMEEFTLCIELSDEALVSATFEESEIFQAAGMLTGYWGASEELRMVLNKDYPEKYREKDYYELAKELRGALLQWGQATTGMQFLDEYRMEFLKHRQRAETSNNLLGEELREGAESSLNFVTELILKWQEEGLYDSSLLL